jgi:hypothetical protein
LIELPVVLFPHCYIKDKDLKRIRAIFDRLIICQPWFMDDPLPRPDGDGESFIDVLLPPANLKPKKDFKRLLSEYHHWIRQNQDRGYAAFLSATQKTAFSEDTPWEIRKMMRRIGEDAPASQENNALKWHIILHLAREFEENLTSADEMLKHMKQKKSPLEDAIGERAPLEGMFEDLPQSGTDLFIDDHHLRQIFEAWFGLFGGILPDYRMFITLNRHVMDYVTEMFGVIKSVPLSQEAVESISPKPTSIQSDLTLTHLSRLSNNGNAHADPVQKGLSGKTIIFLEN